MTAGETRYDTSSVGISGIRRVRDARTATNPTLRVVGLHTGYATMSQGLYEQILGERFRHLPECVQRMHSPQPRLTATGRCSVSRGHGAIVPLVAWVMRFPPSAEDLPLRFEIESRDGAEHWRRHFGASLLCSVFRAHQGRLRERMGPLCLEQDLELRADGLHLLPQRGWFLGIPLPRFLLPRVRAVAWEQRGADGPRYQFDVAAGLPLIGEVVRYRGWLRSG